MATIFISIYRYFNRHPRVFYTLFALSFAGAAFFAQRVAFEEDISKVLPADKKSKRLNEVFTDSRFMDKLVVTVSLKDSTAAPSPDTLVDYAEALVTATRARLGTTVADIRYRVEDSLALSLLATVNEHLPIYLREADYATIDSLTAAPQVKQTLQQNYRTLTSPAGFALKSIISNDPVGISFPAIKKLQQLQFDENFELYDGYIITKDQQHLLLFLQPTYPPDNTGKNAALLTGLDALMDSLATHRFASVKAGYFGTTAVAVGNALQLRRDTLVTQGITVIFLVFFLGYYFRRKSAPFIILIPVLFGALFSLSVVYFVQGSISVIALGTGSVILGIAVNYSLHVFNHYRHTIDMETVIADLAFPMTIGSLTTVGGFLCLRFVESVILQDLGLFAAFSLVGAALGSLLFLPHFIKPGNTRSPQEKPTTSLLDKLASYRPEYNAYLVTGIVIGTVIFAFTARYVSFESSLERMNYMETSLQQAEQDLNNINEYALKSVYLVTEGATTGDALANNDRMISRVEALQEEGVIRKHSGAGSLLMSDSLQLLRIKRWNNYWTPAKKAQLLTVLQQEGKAVGFKESAFEPFSQLLKKAYQPMAPEQVAAIRNNFVQDYITEKPGNTTLVTLVKCDASNRSRVYEAFDGMPSVTVVDKQYLTTTLVQTINNDFSRIALMSSLLVFFVLLLTYGRIELTLVAFLPMLVSWIWILGIMGLFDIRFNIINIIVSALIFGLGDDYSIFIMDGLLQEYKTGRKKLSSFKSSIFLSAITTISGLGVLIFAKHPALRSIALISIIGIVCVVIMSQLLIPFLFKLLVTNRTRQHQLPWTLTGWLRSVFAFCYFVIGAIVLTLLGFVFSKLNPFNKEKGKLVYHKILSRFCRSLMYIMANVKKQVINPLGEDFSRPAVVISNHQSFLDILSMVMLHPKLVLFTNNWVWNSPVFGGVVRMADYFPVEQGVENSIERIAERVQQGYSVVIFPEGTRSADGKIKRFHKGAFYLAEKLGLDLLPILIHGTGHTMTKGDFLLKNGVITIQYLPRITPSDLSFGDGYTARAKQVGGYFRTQYALALQRLEQPAYYRGRLIYNYLYKGPELEWYLKVKLSLEKNYQLFHQLLPTEGVLLDIGCGYGFMSYLLRFCSAGRTITGIDYDAAKINTANHCFDKPEGLQFYCANAMDHPFDSYDAIILADMLHYLPPQQQVALIEKCIRHLRPGGLLIIREGNADMQQRHLGTRITEFFSTRVFRFNKTTQEGLFFLPGNLLRDIATRHQIGYSEIDQSTFTSNMIYVLTNKTAG